MQSVLLVGKPNSGKSLLFNRLTGLKQKVANFPGVTVEVKSGSCGDALIIDFPGVYSLSPLTKDENIAVEKFFQALNDKTVSGVLCVLDATRLERSLVLGLQAQAAAAAKGKAFVFAVNMMDEISRSRELCDIEGLAKELKCRVFPVSAKTGQGLSELKTYLADVTRANHTEKGATEVALTPGVNAHALAREISRKFGPKVDVILKTQNQLDNFLLSGFWGGVAFFAAMTFMFQAIFTWAAPLMDSVEEFLSYVGAIVSAWLPAGVIADFVSDAIFGGFGSFLVFVPQIFMLTFIIGVLEDSGYLARAAIICHKPLSLFGLSGRSFVPLLSGHACSIPAIFAARTIESPKHRLLTIIAIPLMSCSARLPVYGLFVSVLIPPTTVLGGMIGLQGLAFFGLYLLGIVLALLVTALLSRTTNRNESSAPFIIELPPYRFPSWKPLLQRSLNYSWAFVTRAGGVIFMVTLVVWILGYFPNGGGNLETSWLAAMGRWIEPVIAPMGVDWKFGVALIASFVAREVFVGTMGTLYGIEGGEDRIADVAGRIQESGLSLAAGFGLLIFYVVALQCASTLAVIRKETGNAKLPIALFVGYGLLAYVLAILTKWFVTYLTA